MFLFLHSRPVTVLYRLINLLENIISKNIKNKHPKKIQHYQINCTLLEKKLKEKNNTTSHLIIGHSALDEEYHSRTIYKCEII